MFTCASMQDCFPDCVLLFTSARLTVSIVMVIGTNHSPAVKSPYQNIKQSCNVCLLCLILQVAALTQMQDSIKTSPYRLVI